MSTPTSLPPDTDRPGTPSQDTDVGSCSYKSSQSSTDDDSPLDSPSVSPSASPLITLRKAEEEEEEGKKEDPSYELRSGCGCGRSRAQGPGASGCACGRGRGSGAICHDPMDDISVMEEERESKRGSGIRTRGGVTSPRILRRKRREEERQMMELEAMREIPWSMYDDGDNTVSIEVHRPTDDSQVTLPIRVDPEKQLHVILVPYTTTRHSSPVAPEFVSQTIMPFGSRTPTEDVEGQKGSEHPSSTRSVSTPNTTTTPCHRYECT